MQRAQACRDLIATLLSSGRCAAVLLLNCRERLSSQAHVQIHTRINVHMHTDTYHVYMYTYTHTHTNPHAPLPTLTPTYFPAQGRHHRWGKGHPESLCWSQSLCHPGRAPQSATSPQEPPHKPQVTHSNVPCSGAMWANGIRIHSEKGGRDEASAWVLGVPPALMSLTAWPPIPLL